MGNVTYTVPNKSGSYDGDMVVKQYTSINIDTGDTVTVEQPCRGLMILCQGDCTINGTLSMKARGPYANPTANGSSSNDAVNSNGLRLPFLTASGTDSLTAAASLFTGCGTEAKSVISNFKTISSNGTIVTLVRQGASGGSGPSSSQQDGNNGSSGSTGQTGGGGSGGRGWSAGAGSGSYGSCFGGGSGAGGSNGNSAVSGSATAWSGPGGNGETDHSASTSGGCGNPAGANEVTNGSAAASENGTGGLIILVVGGNLTIGSGGTITADGSDSGSTQNGTTDWQASGGASGGGNIVIAYRGTYTNNGTVTAIGGTPGSVASSSYAARGGFGGNGSVQTLQIK